MPEHTSPAPVNAAILVGAGAATTFLAYPPFGLLLPSFLCLVPLVVLLDRHLAGRLTMVRLFGWGFAYAAAASALTLYWLPLALWRFERWTVLGFGPILVLLGLVGGLEVVATAWVAARVRLPLWLVFPPIFVSGEWALAHLGPLHFPWLGLGTSLTAFPALVQVADIVGARGVGWLLAMANVVVAESWLAPRQSRRRRLRLVGLLAGVIACLGYGRIRERTLETRRTGIVGIVQPNVGRKQKWNPMAQDSTMAALISRSESVARDGPLDLIVWPEMAVPAPGSTRPDWEAAIAGRATRGGIALVSGGITDSVAGGRYRYFNAALVFEPGAGVGRPIYRKRFLVPLLEFDPRGATAAPAAGGFGGYSAGTASVAYPTRLGRLAISICYEGAFQEAAAADRRLGADVILNLSNDAWLGRTTGPAQNAAHLVMRAIETRTGVVRAANTGPSLIIDPGGRITAKTRFGESATLVGEVRTAAGLPLAVRWGDWTSRLAVALFALLTTVATMFPSSSAMSVFKGNINLMKGDTTAASAAFREAVRHDSTNGEARGRLRDIGQKP